MDINASAVPDEILSVVRKKVPDIEISEVEIEADDNLRYELSGTTNGREIEIDVTPSGKITEVELDEIDIPVSEVPEEVIKAVKSKYPDFKLEEAEIESSQPLSYEIEGKSGGNDIEIEINSDGSELEIKQE